MKITVAGIGYVGLSLAVLLSQKNEVIAYDLDQDKINKVNNKVSPIADHQLEIFLSSKDLNLKATNNENDAYGTSKYLIISTPTNYDSKLNKFDTSSVEKIIKNAIEINKNIIIIIKSTLPIGYVESVRIKFNYENIYFSPEFLREGKALYDNLYPSRIVVGDKNKVGKEFSHLLSDCAMKSEIPIPILLTNPSEAEAIKLFSNSYLAMRVAYFNEIDNYAIKNNLNTKDIIIGTSYDPRIGNYYNNPSFGYGGYCLPKDTKQLLENFSSTPNHLIKAIVESNSSRKNFIVEDIIARKPNKIGVYRLIMKSGSDNYRESSIMDIMLHLAKRKLSILLYEPLIDENDFKKLNESSNMKIKLISDFAEFKNKCDLIITNRKSDGLEDIGEKLYTRDIFRID